MNEEWSQLSHFISFFYNEKKILLSNDYLLYREEVEELFDLMDRDFDGRLTFDEFIREEFTIEKLFKNMDKTGDGFVTKQVGKS